MIDSQDKPEIDEDTGMIMYEDEEGRENQIPQSDVKEIKER
ncbi:YgdI/YgdR family lipoprotein [Halopseudomonas pelagia]|nr:YgdI/YgdR family lipoprotein [Halopseudomonas pelagia]